jgi:UDP-2-acetamido-3-amino-2,3-dideoxy-glucuronate N-acetyltransferase
MNNIFTHKTAEVSIGANIGNGTKIWHNSQVLSGAEIGDNCTVGHNCFIGKKAKLGKGVKLESNVDVWDLVELEDYVFVGPSVVFTNDRNPRAKYPKSEYPQFGSWQKTLVKEGTTIGANATIICGIEIGRWALVGAGAVVRENIPDYAIVVGNPCKLIGWICECGNKLFFENVEVQCAVCKRKYKKENEKVWEIK